MDKEFIYLRFNFIYFHLLSCFLLNFRFTLKSCFENLITRLNIYAVHKQKYECDVINYRYEDKLNICHCYVGA